MNAEHHPAEAWLLDYTTGNLPESFETVISAHVGACAHCREAVRMAERIGGELLSTLAGEPVGIDAGSIPQRFETEQTADDAG